MKSRYCTYFSSDLHSGNNVHSQVLSLVAMGLLRVDWFDIGKTHQY